MGALHRHQCRLLPERRGIDGGVGSGAHARVAFLAGSVAVGCSCPCLPGSVATTLSARRRSRALELIRCSRPRSCSWLVRFGRSRRSEDGGCSLPRCWFTWHDLLVMIGHPGNRRHGGAPLTPGLLFIVRVCKASAMDLPGPVSPDDVLAQPSRARLFALLSELKRPAGTAELAERLGLHPNGVRLHLEQMQAAGLVERARAASLAGARGTHGRSPPAALPAGQRPNAYLDLGRWLARAIPALPRRLRDVEATGRAIGRSSPRRAPHRRRRSRPHSRRSASSPSAKPVKTAL